MKLTPAETEIMDALWESDHPLTVDEIRQAPHGWKDGSAYIILNGLLHKNAVRPVAMKKACKTYARTFEAAMGRERYLAQLCYDGQQPDTVALIAEILRQAKIGQNDCDAVLIDAKREAYDY